MPPGVINFLPGSAGMITDGLLASPDLAGIHFTGSTEVFQSMWKTVGENIARYKNYPRLVGETGGKDFIVAHPSADPQEVAVAMVRGGFEYQGQKCSAASRIYIPKSLWKEVRDRAVAMIKDIKMGDTRDFRNFMSAVIDKKSFDKISSYVAIAKKSAKILAGGRCDDKKGYFIEPTLVQTNKPDYKLLCEEIFGPVADRVRLSGRQVEGHAQDDRQDVALRTHRLGVLERPQGGARGDERVAERGGQLLHQRQAHRRGRRPAAVRRRARVGHQRQGRLEAQPDPLGQHPDDQGDALAAAGLQIPVHGAE